MPELPEVETVRAQLAPLLAGRRFERVDIRDARLTRPKEASVVAGLLVGEQVADVGRRGKYLVVLFASGRHLLVHLGMTGAVLAPAPAGVGDDPYVRAVVTLDNGSDVAYRDVRRFGAWQVVEVGRLDPFFASRRLGPEPLDRAFTTARLARGLAGRRAPIKAALLDQRAVAGVGNIYADEALWYARIHPLAAAGRLSESDVAALRQGIRKALRLGIRRQGASVRDYRAVDGARGTMQDELRVYGRAGEPCPRCGTPIEKIRVAGRGTWYCPSCQRAS